MEMTELGAGINASTFAESPLSSNPPITNSVSLKLIAPKALRMEVIFGPDS